MSYKKFYIYKEQVSYDNGETWQDTGNQAPSGNPIGTYSTLAECEGITSCTCADFAYSPTAFTVSSAATSVTFRYTGCTKPDLTSAATYNWIAIGNHTYNTGTSVGNIIANVSANTNSSRTAILSVSLSGTACQNLVIFQENGDTPVVDGKYKLTLSDSSTVSAECDASSAITQSEVSSQYSGTVVSVEIGDCVTSIGNMAFYNCRRLTSVTIPDSVTSIGSNTFYECYRLTSVTIPDSVTSIGTGAFANCTSLTSVTVKTITPPTLGSSVFYSTNNCPIYVPSGSVDTYKSASGWSDYASRIQAIP